MIETVKKVLYFPAAFYFYIFAKIKLLIWNPKIIVVTGSSGKTTLLYLIESQLGTKAKYSHKANSSFGIPFDILGMKRQDLTLFEWPGLIIKTPFLVFKKPPKENTYVVEADCDRPFEGLFLANLLKPEITLWLNTTKTHSVNFEGKTKKTGRDLLTVITEEFGNIAKHTKELVIFNNDLVNIERYMKKLKVDKMPIGLDDFKLLYEVNVSGSLFTINGEKYRFPYALPYKTFYQIIMTKRLLSYINLSDNHFKDFKLPAGRSSIFKGIKGITIVDSTYNANLDSMAVVLDMFSRLNSKNKWVVLGDMLEQGRNEKPSHEELAKIINKYDFEKVILMGPRVVKYTSLLVENFPISFLTPDKVNDYLLKNIKGGEIILFKGARFLEGVIESLLLDKKQAKYLIRREIVWQRRREKFGL